MTASPGRRWPRLMPLALLLLAICACGGGSDPKDGDAVELAPPPPAPPARVSARQVDEAIGQFPEEIRGDVERLDDGRVRLGGIEIDPVSGTIAFDGHVNMNEGLIEVIICTPWGKTHESLFVADVRPMLLHAACLLLGLRHGRNPAWLLPEDDPELADLRAEPVGEMLDVTVRWDDEKGTHEAPAGRFLMDESTSRTLEQQAAWVFVGSYIDPAGVYAADPVGSMVTNFHDFSTVIDLALDRGRLDDFMVANKAAMPAPGTPVRVTIKAAAGSKADHVQSKNNETR